MPGSFLFFLGSGPDTIPNKQPASRKAGHHGVDWDLCLVKVDQACFLSSHSCPFQPSSDE